MEFQGFQLSFLHELANVELVDFNGMFWYFEIVVDCLTQVLHCCFKLQSFHIICHLLFYFRMRTPHVFRLTDSLLFQLGAVPWKEALDRLSCFPFLRLKYHFAFVIPLDFHFSWNWQSKALTFSSRRGLFWVALSAHSMLLAFVFDEADSSCAKTADAPLSHITNVRYSFSPSQSDCVVKQYRFQFLDVLSGVHVGLRLSFRFKCQDTCTLTARKNFWLWSNSFTYDATFFLARSKRLLDNQACDILWLDLQIFVLKKFTFFNVIGIPYSYSVIFELEVVWQTDVWYLIGFMEVFRRVNFDNSDTASS